MRSTADRIRHALSFEFIGLILVTPLGALVFHLPLLDVGVITVGGASAAMVWNYIYNWCFDRALLSFAGSTRKSQPIRVLHAVLFEIGLMLLLMPLIAWYLQIELWQALVMDAAFAVFYMVYAYAFNLAYDRLFPLGEWQREPA
ncbi:MAG: PACE efflux transporter [Devosia sp.]|nr:PACE efflux transporter [Devosia sp.]